MGWSRAAARALGALADDGDVGQREAPLAFEGDQRFAGEGSSLGPGGVRGEGLLEPSGGVVLRGAQLLEDRVDCVELAEDFIGPLDLVVGVNVAGCCSWLRT